MSNDVFLSYSKYDSHIALHISAMLRSYGIESFLAEKDLKSGTKWMPRVRKAIKSSDRVFILVTPRSIKSDWVLLETGAAWMAGKRITPLLMFVKPEDLPEAARERQIAVVETQSQLEAFVEEVARSDNTDAPRAISMRILSERILEAADRMDRDKYYPDLFVGSGRRGSVCAAVFASRAGNAPFKAVDCHFRGEGGSRKTYIDSSALVERDIQKKNVLVVEWARQSGRTYRKILSALQPLDPAGIKSFAMVWTKETKPGPDYWAFDYRYVPRGPWAYL